MLNRIWKIVVWPWFHISNAKNVTLTGAILFFQAKKELNHCGWPLLDIEALSKQCTSTMERY